MNKKKKIELITLLNLKEVVKVNYQKYYEIINPILKFLTALVTIIVLKYLFGYSLSIDKPLILFGIAIVQAFLPMSYLFYAGSIFIMINLASVSMDICIAFVAFIIICMIGFIRIDHKYSCLVMIVPVLFVLKIEYLFPVLFGILFGVGSILPSAAGIVLYFFSTYIKDVNVLLTSNDTIGIGLERVASLMQIDKTLLVIFVSFIFIIIISAFLYHYFHEYSWIFAIVIGNVGMAFMVLSGRLIFNLDCSIWRVLLESILAIGLCTVVQFIKGIGDITRIEKTQFEDEEYIYYVKAVPKMKLSQPDPSILIINKAVSGTQSETGQQERLDHKETGEDTNES